MRLLLVCSRLIHGSRGDTLSFFLLLLLVKDGADVFLRPLDLVHQPFFFLPLG